MHVYHAVVRDWHTHLCNTCSLYSLSYKLEMSPAPAPSLNLASGCVRTLHNTCPAVPLLCEMYTRLQPATHTTVNPRQDLYVSEVEMVDNTRLVHMV